MKHLLVVAIALLVPAVAGGVLQTQDLPAALGNQAGPAELVAGDIGTPTIGASGHSAAVTLGTLPLAADDILALDASDDSWNVHAELVSSAGWGLAESITLSIGQGILSEPQVVITLGSLVQSLGNPVDLPALGAATEVRVVGFGTGTLSVDLVLTPDGVANTELRFRVDLTV